MMEDRQLTDYPDGLVREKAIFRRLPRVMMDGP